MIMRARNNTGATISNGSVVYISGTSRLQYVNNSDVIVINDVNA